MNVLEGELFVMRFMRWEMVVLVLMWVFLVVSFGVFVVEWKCILIILEGLFKF